MTEQFKVGVPHNRRVHGWLYDADSGECLGIASYQMREKHGFGVVFRHFMSTCPHRAIIHEVTQS